MLQLRVEGTDRLQQHLQKLLRTIPETAAAAMRRAAYIVETRAKVNLNNNVLKVDTGALRSSVKTDIKQDKLAAEVGTNLVYGPIHEFGGIVRPVRARMLAIPLARQKGSPRNEAGLFLIRSRAGNLLLMNRKGPRWVLKEQVRIPRRPWLEPAYSSSIDDIKEGFLAQLSGTLNTP